MGVELLLGLELLVAELAVGVLLHVDLHVLVIPHQGHKPDVAQLARVVGRVAQVVHLHVGSHLNLAALFLRERTYLLRNVTNA